MMFAVDFTSFSLAHHLSMNTFIRPILFLGKMTDTSLVYEYVDFFRLQNHFTILLFDQRMHATTTTTAFVHSLFNSPFFLPHDHATILTIFFTEILSHFQMQVFSRGRGLCNTILTTMSYFVGPVTILSE